MRSYSNVSVMDADDVSVAVFARERTFWVSLDCGSSRLSLFPKNQTPADASDLARRLARDLIKAADDFDANRVTVMQDAAE